MGLFRSLGRSIKKRVRRGRHRLHVTLARRKLRALLCEPHAKPFSPCVYCWVLPVSAEHVSLARETLRSLQKQIAGDWQLVLVECGTSSPALDAFLSAACADQRVTVCPAGRLPAASRLDEQTTGKPSGRSAEQAYVDGSRVANGTWIGFLRPESRLAPDTLLWLDLSASEHPHVCWFYSDERYRLGRKRKTNYKPDFSIEHLWSHPFTGQLAIYRKDLLDRLGLPTTEFGQAWQHDLQLRLSDQCRPEQVGHIPVVLHETVLPAGSNLDQFLSQTPDHHAAVRAALNRRGVAADMTPWTTALGLPRLRLRPQRFPRVTVVVATRDHAELVIPCVTSLRENTNYPNYDLVVIDNQSREERLLEYLAAESARERLRVHRYDKPFNHSEMHNELLFGLDTEYAVLVNNDVYGFSSGWLEELVATAEIEPRIAGVGAKLFYDDDSIQHAGIVMGFGSVAGHSHARWPGQSDGYFGRLNTLQEYCGATAALLLLRRETFCEIGGFDGERFPTTYNDVDLWLRLRQAGYRCLYNPSVQAYHLESKTRKSSPLDAEYGRRIQSLWGPQLQRDPFYNANLSLKKPFWEDWTKCNPRELLSLMQQRLAPAPQPRREQQRDAA